MRVPAHLLLALASLATASPASLASNESGNDAVADLSTKARLIEELAGMDLSEVTTVNVTTFNLDPDCLGAGFFYNLPSGCWILGSENFVSFLPSGNPECIVTAYASHLDCTGMSFVGLAQGICVNSLVDQDGTYTSYELSAMKVQCVSARSDD